MAPGDEAEFAAFVAARSRALLRTAFLLCGDWGQAEDLLQTALGRTYLAWPRLRDRDRPEAYVRRVLATTHVDARRRFWHRERATGTTPEPSGVDPYRTVDEWDALRRALLSLGPRQRAAVVLRYYDDLSVDEVAEVLGCAAGTVKSQSARGLATLRAAMTGTDVGTEERA